MTPTHDTNTDSTTAGWSCTPAALKAHSRANSEQLVDGVLPSQGVVTLAGAPGIGKSFLALSLAACVSAGRPWFGRATKQGPVVYVLGEGFHQFGRRVEAWEQHSGYELADDLHFVDGAARSIDLADDESFAILLEHLVELRPALVVLDTFSMLASVRSENDNAEVARVYARAHRLVRETGATVLFVHHVPKEGSGVRGATAFVGNSDTVLIAGRPEDDTFSLSSRSSDGGKQRDAEPFAMAGFSIAAPGVLVNSKAASVKSDLAALMAGEAL